MKVWELKKALEADGVDDDADVQVPAGENSIFEYYEATDAYPDTDLIGIATPNPVRINVFRIDT